MKKENVKQTELNLLNDELSPSNEKQRNVISITCFAMCIGFYVQLVAFISGAQMFPALSPLKILLFVRLEI